MESVGNASFTPKKHDLLMGIINDSNSFSLAYLFVQNIYISGFQLAFNLSLKASF